MGWSEKLFLLLTFISLVAFQCDFVRAGDDESRKDDNYATSSDDGHYEPEEEESDSYRLTLKNIYISHGDLSPPFTPQQKQYDVYLQQPHDQLALTPIIFQDRKEYDGSEANLPLIRITWPGHDTSKVHPEPSSVAVRKQIDLPDDGGSLLVTIEIKNPLGHGTLLYTVNVHQGKGTLNILKNLEATDDRGAVVLIEPVASQDASVYSVYAHPDASQVYLSAKCLSSWLTIDGRTVQNGQPFTVLRDRSRHVQFLTVACGSGGLFGSEESTHYFLRVISDYPQDQIPRPRLVVDDVGQTCDFNENKQAFGCPNPKDKKHRTRIIGYVEPSVRYTVESDDGEVEVRLLNHLPSIPFTYRSDLTVHAVAGRFNATWPLKFDVPFGGGGMKYLGMLLSALLAVLLSSLLVVLGLSNSLGIGTPFKATEIAGTLTLLLQYFSFANFLRGHGLMTEMTDTLKWVTLYWPLPWRMNHRDDHLGRQLAASSDRPHIGDVQNIENAFGCLWWSMTIFLGMLLLHLGIIIKFKCCERNYTFPHRLRLGNWETKCLHWLTFPAMTAASMILASSQATTLWKVLAGLTIAGAAVWLIVSAFLVHKVVKDRQVLWVWNSSLREDGALENETGYWSDTTCDQLTTQPTNRSFCKSFFTWDWISTVADIVPLVLAPRSFNRRNYGDADSTTSMAEHLYAPDEYQSQRTAYPLAKNPQSVEVHTTRAPGCVCPGQRLVAGLFRTPWLDALFTYEGLTKFHAEVATEVDRELIIPLTVKTNQLQGPLTGGRYNFFFRGARVPFIRIGDLIFRILLGVFVGVALASDNYKVDAAMFCLTGLLCIGGLIYTLMARPYSRSIENWLLAAIFAAISLSSWSFMAYALSKKQPSIFSDIFLWFTAVVCVVLAGYACVVIFSLFSALLCPPLEETRFLERLANCNMSISDHQAGWNVDMPAYIKHSCRSIKAQCNFTSDRNVHVSVFSSGEEPCLEFSSDEMRSACVSGSLQHPVLCLFAPSSHDRLGYRHINFFDTGSAPHSTLEFLSRDGLTKDCASEVSRQVAHYLNAVRGKNGVICLSVVPPDELMVHHKKHGSSSSSSTTSGGYTWSTSSSSRYSSSSTSGRHRGTTSSSGYTSSYSTNVEMTHHSR